MSKNISEYRSAWEGKKKIQKAYFPYVGEADCLYPFIKGYLTLLMTALLERGGQSKTQNQNKKTKTHKRSGITVPGIADASRRLSHKLWDS